MEITIKWFTGKYPSFNVGLSSKAGKDPFLEIKGCRIVNGANGEFVATPSTKNAQTEKYWNHAYFAPDFAAVVLEKAKESMPKDEFKAEAEKHFKKGGVDDFKDDLPF